MGSRALFDPRDRALAPTQSDNAVTGTAVLHPGEYRTLVPVCMMPGTLAPSGLATMQVGTFVVIERAHGTDPELEITVNWRVTVPEGATKRL